MLLPLRLIYAGSFIDPFSYYRGISSLFPQKSRLATNLLLRLQSRAQQSWDVPTSLNKDAPRGAAGGGNVALSATVQHPTV